MATLRTNKITFTMFMSKVCLSRQIYLTLKKNPMINSQTESDTSIMPNIIMSLNSTKPDIKIIPLERYIFTT